MVSAQRLVLRRRLSLLVWSLLLSVGTVVLYFGWATVQHASGSRPPAGGVDGLFHGLEIVGIFMGPLAAVLIGAEAGAGDTATGVIRDLIVTGRSRWALFAARIPGALALALPMIALAYAVVIAATYLLAGGNPTPSAWTVIQGLGWTLLVDGIVCVVAVGLASVTNSRPATITTLIGFELVASPLLLQSTSLGSARKVLLDASVLHLVPVNDPGAPHVPESLGVAVIVMIVWLAVAIAAGAWRASTMDA
jgi:ABC-type transport system involved in multi-copper enzyme maturation permease subunit